MGSQEVSVLRRLAVIALRCAARLRKGSRKTDESRIGSPCIDGDEDLDGGSEDQDAGDDIEALRLAKRDLLANLGTHVQDETVKAEDQERHAQSHDHVQDAAGRISSHHEAADGSSGKEDLDGRDHEAEWMQRALVMLDVVPTLVGEVWGQRDLLNARETW